ncbi:hypothetical protein LCGC14_0625480 [marine sediment metagenome]|uniref:Uncharacterized protein n=1 Tax=marine sediment metagenome TaxID=412755 RepID=A0A0F9UC05_9ZZZZ|nr:MAG: hypothetical protein Lokiarch_04130 [Candidatus Lokiarchaeum sp. GC14_75]
MHISEKRRSANFSPTFESRALSLYPSRSLDTYPNSSLITLINDKGDLYP